METETDVIRQLQYAEAHHGSSFNMFTSDRAETSYEKIYRHNCHDNYGNIAKYIIKRGIYLPHTLVKDFEYVDRRVSKEKQEHRKAKIMHELITEHFYNRTWTPKGDGKYDPELVHDAENNPIKKEAFGVTFHVYKQDSNDKNILTQRGWKAAAYSTSMEDKDKALLLMYATYPKYTKVDPFKKPSHTMGPVYYISEENNSNFNELSTYW